MITSHITFAPTSTSSQTFTKFLERLRLKDKERTIWVDAIYINQEDLSERAIQVLLMREIYANARQVLIWLGEEEDCDEHAFEYLDRISTRLHELEDSLEEDRVDAEGDIHEWQ
jgi:hypothetical protein